MLSMVQLALKENGLAQTCWIEDLRGRAGVLGGHVATAMTMGTERHWFNGGEKEFTFLEMFCSSPESRQRI